MQPIVIELTAAIFDLIKQNVCVDSSKFPIEWFDILSIVALKSKDMIPACLLALIIVEC